MRVFMVAMMGELEMEVGVEGEMGIECDIEVKAGGRVSCLPRPGPVPRVLAGC